jgi:serine/threonine protein kinase
VPLALPYRAPPPPLPSPPSLGFAFGDLKPENILLTASGHAKLTDFGAARPLPGHTAAIAALASAGKVILELRDGDWRAKRQATAAPARTEGAHGGGGGGGGAAEGELPEAAAEPMEEEEEEEDTRLEGTALYLSPELVRGGRPTVASDCWALGCTLYQAAYPNPNPNPNPNPIPNPNPNPNPNPDPNPNPYARSTRRSAASRHSGQTRTRR